MQRISRFRMIIFIIVILTMIGVFSLRLYKTQAAVTEDSLVAADADSMTYQSTVEAARGNILDRNGNVLVSNRASYNLVIINFVFFNAPDPNGNLLKVLNLCDELGIRYESHFPVSSERPYTYTDTNDTAWQGYFRSFLASRSYDLDISAPTLMKRLRDEYKIPDDWAQQDVYRVISVRYELELRSVDGIGMENYTLAEDVDAESLAAVMELAVPGVVVENGTVREYNTTHAAHILGYIGPIWSEEAAEYREKGYSMNALVGKSGVEQAFEEYLHGSSGIKKTTVSSTGEILNRYYVTEPVPGNNVELTIDISLQAVAEQALEKVILDLRENGVGRNKEGKDAQGGAVVVQLCKTGEILAIASYPTYDLATFNQNYTELDADELRPLYNRALAAYPPGSVYKMVTAIAAVDMGGFDPGYIIEDKGLYTFYESFQPKCHIWSLANPRTHGKINLMEAIAYSCNYYFYEVGRLTYDSYMKQTGENPFDIVAKALGLGEPTGIELPEDTGSRANAEEKNAQYAGEDAGWFGADVLQAVIGQSLNKFTPLQLACYASALANKGTRYEATLLSRVVSWDYQNLIKESQPVVASTLEISEKALAALDQGMRMTCSIGTAEQYLKDYPIAIACKTGTAQWQGTTSTGSFSGSDHASFVLYAPADDPEISIAVYVERGSQGGNLANVCIPILDAYFSSSTKYETVATENIAY